MNHDPARTERTIARCIWGFLALLVLIALLGGCASPGVRTPERIAEFSWQTMHAIDAGQTMHIASAPTCYREADPLTKALIGEHPSESEVAAVMVGYALLHGWVSHWLDKKDTLNEYGEHDSPWYVAKIAWHGVGLFTKGMTIANNHSIGLRPGGEGCP